MTENILREILEEAVDEPPHAISPRTIQQLGWSRRRSRWIAASAGIAAVVAAAIVVPYLVAQPSRIAPLAQASPPPDPGLCASAPPESAAEPMPIMLKVEAIVYCTTQIVRRPGQGIWLQRWEQRSEAGASIYAEALEPPNGGLKCKPNETRVVVVPGPNSPNLVLDATGRLRRIAIPDACLDGKPPIDSVSASLVWHTVATTWLIRLLPEAEADSACARKWLHDPNHIGDRLTSPSGPSGNRHLIGAGRGDLDTFCIVRAFPSSGPAADSFIAASKLTGAEADRVRIALSALPGVSAIRLQRGGKPCTAPAKNVWVLKVDGKTIGYAGFDDCARGVDADLHTSDELQALVGHYGNIG